MTRIEKLNKYVKGITLITREFVEDVEKEMLLEAKIQHSNEMFVDMVCTYVDRYEKELESDLQEVFGYMASDKSKITHFNALTHSASYKQVIVDILQGKAK